MEIRQRPGRNLNRRVPLARYATGSGTQGGTVQQAAGSKAPRKVLLVTKTTPSWMPRPDLPGDGLAAVGVASGSLLAFGAVVVLRNSAWWRQQRGGDAAASDIVEAAAPLRTGLTGALQVEVQSALAAGEAVEARARAAQRRTAALSLPASVRPPYPTLDVAAAQQAPPAPQQKEGSLVKDVLGRLREVDRQKLTVAEAAAGAAAAEGASPPSLPTTTGTSTATASPSSLPTPLAAIANGITAPIAAAASGPIFAAASAADEGLAFAARNPTIQDLTHRVDEVLQALEQLKDGPAPPLVPQAAAAARATLQSTLAASKPSAAGGALLAEADPLPAELSLPSQRSAAAEELINSRSSSSFSSSSTSSALPPSSSSPRPRLLPSTSSPGSNKSLMALKSELLDVVYGTARGLDASAEQRALVEEYVTALEARNPSASAASAAAMTRLSGCWKLVYTSGSGALMLLNALRSVPLLGVGDVYQIIDGRSLSAQNRIDVAVPVAMSLRADSGLELLTPRCLKVRFTKVGVDTYIETPGLLASLQVPEVLSVLGARLDLAFLRPVINPLNDTLGGATALIGRLLSSPELPLPGGQQLGAAAAAAPAGGVWSAPPGSDMAPSAGGGSGGLMSVWMVTTYLDDNLRISRDEAGRVFVMLKDLTPLAPPESAAADAPAAAAAIATGGAGGR